MGVAKIILGDIPEDLTEIVIDISSGAESVNAKRIGEQMLFEEVHGRLDALHNVEYYAKFGTTHL